MTLRMIATGLAAVLAGALVHPATAQERPVIDPADLASIQAAVTDVAAGADRRDWPRVRAAFADEVTTDYTALWGGDPVTQPADDLVAQWSGFLPGFEATHHMVTNLAVTSLDAAEAEAEADFTATHRIGGDLWTLGGRYDYGLARKGDRWVITSLTMTPVWETGDRGLVAQAGERAAAGN